MLISRRRGDDGGGGEEERHLLHLSPHSHLHTHSNYSDGDAGGRAETHGSGVQGKEGNDLRLPCQMPPEG